ncbi:hypothetical protein [Streptomyces sp. NPDC002545]
MTTRRTLGAGPEAPAQGIRAIQADLLDSLPGIHLPDIGELRARGVVGGQPPVPSTARRSLGAGPADALSADSPADIWPHARRV